MLFVLWGVDKQDTAGYYTASKQKDFKGSAMKLINGCVGMHRACLARNRIYVRAHDARKQREYARARVQERNKAQEANMAYYGGLPPLQRIV